MKMERAKLVGIWKNARSFSNYPALMVLVLFGVFGAIVWNSVKEDEVKAKEYEKAPEPRLASGAVRVKSSDATVKVGEPLARELPSAPSQDRPCSTPKRTRLEDWSGRAKS